MWSNWSAVRGQASGTWVVRTRRPLFRSRPGQVLLGSTIVLIGVALALPFVPFAGVFGFVPSPAALGADIGGITVLDVTATEWTKRRLSVTGP